MKKLISGLITLAVLFYVGRFLVQMTLGRDFLAHSNECYAEQHIVDRINTSLSDSEVDDLYNRWESCTKQKNNIVDAIFGQNKFVEQAMQAMKEDRKAKGPFRDRGHG
jgi:hypothetical protein